MRPSCASGDYRTTTWWDLQAALSVNKSELARILRVRGRRFAIVFMGDPYAAKQGCEPSARPGRERRPLAMPGPPAGVMFHAPRLILKCQLV